MMALPVELPLYFPTSTHHSAALICQQWWRIRSPKHRFFQVTLSSLCWKKHPACNSLLPFSPSFCQHFKQLVDELQAKGVGTVNKALTESFKILREVRVSAAVRIEHKCPCPPLLSPPASYDLVHPSQWGGVGGWHKLISQSLTSQQAVCRCDPVLWRCQFVHGALRLQIPSRL